ncbi:MAG: hypothetical protein J6S43_04045 [Lentisphaeria bacterium]|nr:hypothetical protein [Lentisphaeria bacterium]
MSGMRKLYLSICCAVFTLTVCGAEKIVFAGDLLTYSGDYRAIAQVYMALRKPEQKLYLLNAGIMGETAADALRRVDWDILHHQPSKVFLLFGLSDVRKNIRYTRNGAVVDPASIQSYKSAMEQMTDKLLAAGCKVVLVSPFPYDQESDIAAYNEKLNGDPGFAGLTAVLKDIAAQKNVELLDVHTELSRIIAAGDGDINLFRKNSRVDPSRTGSVALAMLIAENLGANIPVAEVKIDAAAGKYDAKGAELRYFRASDRSVRFTYRPERLPLPVDRDYRALAEVMELDKKLNSEMLSVTGLAEGMYEFKINGITVKTFSASDLAGGINLAHIDTTSNRTAKELSGLVPRLISSPGALRRLAVAGDIIRRSGGEPVDKAAGMKILEQTAAGSKDKIYLAQVITEYQKNIDKKDVLEKQILTQIDSLYSRAALRQFSVEITPMAGN